MKNKQPSIDLGPDLPYLLDFLQERQPTAVRLATKHIDTLQDLKQHCGLSFDDLLTVLLHRSLTTLLQDIDRDIEAYEQFQADAKDLALAVGDNIDITSELITDFYGAATRVRSRITRQSWATPGHTLNITAVDERYYDRYFIFAADDAPDYDAATDAQKASIGYISADSDPYFADGGDAYKFL